MSTLRTCLGRRPLPSTSKHSHRDSTADRHSGKQIPYPALALPHSSGKALPTPPFWVLVSPIHEMGIKSIGQWWVLPGILQKMLSAEPGTWNTSAPGSQDPITHRNDLIHYHQWVRRVQGGRGKSKKNVTSVAMMLISTWCHLRQDLGEL